MVILIKNAEVYAPEKRGRKDVLVLDQHIAAIGDNLKVDFGGEVPVTEVDLSLIHILDGVVRF